MVDVLVEHLVQILAELGDVGEVLFMCVEDVFQRFLALWFR